MKIGIIGAGNMGFTLAKLFIKARYQVAISNSRGPESLQEMVKQLGDNCIALKVNDAAAFGDVVLLTVPWRSPEALPDPQYLKDKIVIDAMNPYKENGELFELGESTSSEETAKRLPGSLIVKAFNTIHFKHLADAPQKELPLQERRAIFIAGDNTEAKAKVARLIEQIGFAGIDNGSLHDGGKLQEPNAELYNKEITCGEALTLEAKNRK
ncbi:NADP oxidoreductase coenzyme F420-dependent [Mucilaginibacter paludis DSM 18603]|uniref:NADP oxidoreductase coenzyme F420-dependent n=2 Tax=Mucilaginibacter TaxID=423349 RepID=H1Y3N7_9SPHI|nr:NADPH-dependent F420 reductase [Mucilaginibacter paludis]EHQ30299.1 NADP oxidoreductase coenzyme F420-dependent [Mucilaginibacter paludis DSM 18603]